ncbi:MAG: MBL fold metallo-hydrolase [Bacillota bacterium]|nr:MBL fold metallo-hydrolase [Bacillota bacterium]
MQGESERAARWLTSWGRVEPLAPGLWRIAEPVGRTGEWGVDWVNAFLVEGERRALLFDSGMGVGPLEAVVRLLTAKPLSVVLSHWHWDHAGGARRLAALAEGVWAHPADGALLARGEPDDDLRQAVAGEIRRGLLPAEYALAPGHLGPLPTRPAEEGRSFDLGGRRALLLHTPGHTPGGLTLLLEPDGWLFPGDLAYRGGLLWLQEAEADPAAYARSLDRLAALDGVRALYGGHDPAPQPPAMLAELRAAFEEARRRLERGEAEGWGTGARRVTVDGFGFLMPGGREEER